MKIYQARPIADGVSRSLDAASIEKLVQDCDIITLIREEALEAGYILNILYSLDKLSDMKTQQSVDDFEDIEEMFMKSFWEEISKFKTEKFDEDVACALPKEKPKQIDSIKVEKPETHNFLLEDLTGEADALLSMAFDEYMSITNGVAENTQQIDEDLINCDKMCERFVERSFFLIFFKSILFLKKNRFEIFENFKIQKLLRRQSEMMEIKQTLSNSFQNNRYNGFSVAINNHHA